MLPGPLLSVEPELATRLRPGASLYLTGFRRADLAAVRQAYEAHFDVPSEPTLVRDDGWLLLACRRREGAAVDAAALAEGAVDP